MNEIEKEKYAVPADAYNSVSWQDIFVINPDSKSGISFKHGTIEKRNKTVGTVLKANRLGSNPRGWQVSYKGKFYLVHRLVYILTYGRLPDDCFVDHKDGNALNNNPSNLRTVSYRANTQNKTMSKVNSSGYTGVLKFTLINRLGKEYNYWRAFWSNNVGTTRTANYSIAKLGDAQALCKAIERRDVEIALLNLSGMSYTSRHGKP